MGVSKRQQVIRAMRGQIWSPGRPPVGSRWFRHAGGMPPISLAPLSGRYLSFAEREEIAILHAQHLGPIHSDILFRFSGQRSLVIRIPCLCSKAFAAA